MESHAVNAPGRSGHRGEAIRLAGERVVKELALLRRCLNVKLPDEERVDLTGAAPPPTDAPPPPERTGAGEVTVAVRRESRVDVAVTATAKESDPLVLDLNGDGRLSTSSVERGARFDINGDGVDDRTSFVSGGDAFLAMDANGDGIISSGRELFGDQTGAMNGYDNLARHDTDGNGWIDRNDPVYGALRLVTGAGEGLRVGDTLSLSQAGIDAIRVAYEETSAVTNGGDRLAQSSTYRKSDGTEGMTGDILLRYL